MRIIIFTFLFASFIVFSCTFKAEKKEDPVRVISDQIFQYSVFAGLTNKIYDGDLTVGRVKENGDIGLGTFNGLNGEMIVLDGRVYRFMEDGTLVEPVDTETVPFTVVTFFDEDQLLQIDEPVNFEQMKGIIEASLPSENFGYAFKIEGSFEYMKCGGASQQEKPYTKTLAEALVDRPIYEGENITGTMVGFWFPEYTGKVNIVGFHLHFISDNRKIAGHVMEFLAPDLQIGIDHVAEFRIVLPENENFRQAGLDLSQGYSLPASGK